MIREDIGYLWTPKHRVGQTVLKTLLLPNVDNCYDPINPLAYFTSKIIDRPEATPLRIPNCIITKMSYTHLRQVTR